jgi:hypothetical protein
MDLEPGCLYWLPETRELPPQRAVLIELSRERDSVLFEVLPSDRAGGRTRYEYVKRNWAVALIEPYYA